MSISLSNFVQTLRPYQQAAVDRALQVPRGGSLVLASPTGTGKGSIELGLLRAFHEKGLDALIITPNIEIIRGYLERCGACRADLQRPAEFLVSCAEEISVRTPVRLRNALQKGKCRVPDVIIVDEAHHAVLDTISGGGLRELCPGTTWIGFTATPYRGTPDETKELRNMWGEPHIVLTVPQAVENKSWDLPSWKVIGIVDDDDCNIKAGELNSDEVTLKNVEPLANMLHGLDLSIPTCVTVPCVKAATELAAAMSRRSVSNTTVIGDMPAPERAEAYERVKTGGTLLISVKVLGEGVDMPWLRRWVDASPTLSPVSFVQKLGRITRPNHIPPEYIGTNRNLERHGYLLQGALPRDAIKQAQEAFGGASVRGGRAGLLKCVRHAKPIDLPLTGGVKGTMWSLWRPAVRGSLPASLSSLGSGSNDPSSPPTSGSVDALATYERCILPDPTSDKVVSAAREIKAAGTENRWGKWVVAPLPDNIDGFRTSRLNGECSDKQYSWWQKSGPRYGLDPEVRPTRAQFSALPTLTDLDTSMNGDKPDAPPKVEPPPIPATGAAVPIVSRGYYTVVREDGSRRTYKVEKMAESARFAPGKTVLYMLVGPSNTKDYKGVAFLGERGASCWKSANGMEEAIRKDWLTITGDIKEAGKRYALQSGNCYVCGKLLTTPESVANGIGPVCLAEQT